MPEFALVGPSGAIERFSRTVTQNVPTKEGWRWLPVIDVGRDLTPSDVQLKEGPAVVVGPSEVTRTWSIRDKTPAEVDSDKTDRVDRVDLLVFRILFSQENRLRVLEGRPAVTAIQFRSALKDLL